LLGKSWLKKRLCEGAYEGELYQGQKKLTRGDSHGIGTLTDWGD